MEVAQQVLQDAGELMLGAMALDDVWVAILGGAGYMYAQVHGRGRGEDDGISS